MTAPILDGRPRLLISIDTEGDNAWSRPRDIGVRNAGYLGRFQALCERHGFLPTYLVNYEMASSPVFQEFGRDVLARGTGEIGMHLHAWNSPPALALTDDDYRRQPYLIEYPAAAMEAKIRYMTELLEDTFAVPMRSHRAGRWALDGRYAALLVKYGYVVDCSVTPLVSWREAPGSPEGRGGTDYTDFPQSAYFMDLDDISRPGTSPLLELPMTVRVRRYWLGRLLPESLPMPAWLRRRLAHGIWFRPAPGNEDDLLWVLRHVMERNEPYIEFMLHSSEFMPGGSPNFVTRNQVEQLYAALERVFAEAARHFVGSTLTQYADAVRRGDAPALGQPANGAR